MERIPFGLPPQAVGRSVPANLLTNARVPTPRVRFTARPRSSASSPTRQFDIYLTRHYGITETQLVNNTSPQVEAARPIGHQGLVQSRIKSSLNEPRACALRTVTPVAANVGAREPTSTLLKAVQHDIRGRVSRDLYLPIAFVEGLGWATIGRYQFEYAANILIAVLNCETDNARANCLQGQPLEHKLDYLLNLSRTRLLKHAWWQTLRSISKRGLELNQQFSIAAFGATYSRGSGSLEDILRPLAARAGAPSTSPGMTPSKLRAVADGFRVLAREACDLADLLLNAREKLISKPLQGPNGVR